MLVAKIIEKGKNGEGQVLLEVDHHHVEKTSVRDAVREPAETVLKPVEFGKCHLLC